MRGLLAVLIVGLLFISSLGYVAKRLQNPKFLVSQTQEVNLYGRLSEQLDKVLPDNFIKGAPLTKAETADVIKQTITAEEFYNFLEIYSTAYLNYWNRKSADLKINYSLVAIKDRAKSSLTAKLLAKYDNLPVCDAVQARNWDISENFPTCRLEDGSISQESIERQLAAQVGTMVGELPNEVKVDGADQKQQANRNIVAAVNTGIKIAWIATVFIVLLMLAIWRQRAFMPLAGALLFVGIIQIGFSLVAWDWIAKNVGDALAGSVDAQLAPLALDATAAVLEVLKTALGNLTIVIIGTGAGLLVLGIISAIKGRKNLSLSVK